jgi:hypothetical protein
LDLLKTLEEKLIEKNEKKTPNSELQKEKIKEEKKTNPSYLKLLKEDLESVFIASEIFKNPFI